MRENLPIFFASNRLKSAKVLIAMRIYWVLQVNFAYKILFPKNNGRISQSTKGFILTRKLIGRHIVLPRCFVIFCNVLVTQAITETGEFLQQRRMYETALDI